MASVFDDDPAPPANPDGDLDRRVLTALRRLIRAADLYSRRLVVQHRITGPQLVCLNQLAEADVLTVTELARRVQLSPSTVVRILDRLEAKSFVTRTRSAIDRRIVAVTITPQGRQFSQITPYSTQHPLRQALQTLAPADRVRIADDLEHLVEAMDASVADPASGSALDGLGTPGVMPDSPTGPVTDH